MHFGMILIYVLIGSDKMSKYITKAVSSAMKFFALEVDGFDILNSTEVTLRKNIIVNRILMITNLLMTIFVIVLNQAIPLHQSILLLIPSFGLNILVAYFVHTKKDDYEKQLIGMYVGVISVCWIAFRFYSAYPQPYTYMFIYFALVIIALFQNRNAMILGDVFIFVIATFLHLDTMYKLESQDNVQSLSIITNQETALQEIMVYTLFLILFMLVITSMVFFSEYMDGERKKELKKRETLELEFNNVLFNVFDTIEDFTQVTEGDQISSSEYVTALMSKKLGILLNFDENKCDELFSFAVAIGLNHDFSLEYDEEKKQSLLKDYQKIKYKLDVGSALLRRTRIKMKCEAMVRTAYESWFVSENFKRIKSEDSSIENQIVFLCESYVILREKQSYKKAFAHAKAIKELTDTFKHLFDEKIFDVFLENHVEFEIIYERAS